MTELLVPVVLGATVGTIGYKAWRGAPEPKIIPTPPASARREVNDYWRNRADPGFTIQSTNRSDYQNIYVERPREGLDALVRLPEIERNNNTIIGHPGLRQFLMTPADRKSLAKLNRPVGGKAPRKKKYTMPV
jgi:hypothetical protein